jgi:hypothetical protein
MAACDRFLQRSTTRRVILSRWPRPRYNAPTDPSTNRSSNQSTNQSTGQSNQSSNQSTGQDIDQTNTETETARFDEAFLVAVAFYSRPWMSDQQANSWYRKDRPQLRRSGVACIPAPAGMKPRTITTTNYCRRTRCWWKVGSSFPELGGCCCLWLTSL